MINLKAYSDFEKALKNYLDENISPELTQKINSGDKTLTGCANFIIAEMREKAKMGCAVASDDEVYGLAVHFFEESSIKGVMPINKVVVISAPKKEKVAPVQMPAEKKKAQNKDEQLEGQVSIFDILGAAT